MLNGNIDLTPLINILIKLAALIWAFKLLPLIKSKLTESQFNKLKAVTEAAVYAAEKLYGAGHGDEKLDWAIKDIEKKGFTADRSLIESFVMKLTLEMDWWGENDLAIGEDEDEIIDSGDDLPLLSNPDHRDNEDEFEDEGIEEVEHGIVEEYHTDTIDDE